MARQLRFEYKNACNHVMNRENRGMQVYPTTKDHTLFLEKLQEYSEIYAISIRTCCLMSDHFHLYLSTPEVNLSDFMLSFLTSFNLSKNRRDSEQCHLFQDRFKALLLEDEMMVLAYSLQMTFSE